MSKQKAKSKNKEGGDDATGKAVATDPAEEAGSSEPAKKKSGGVQKENRPAAGRTGPPPGLGKEVRRAHCNNLRGP